MKKGKFQSNTSRHIRGSARTIALILALVLLVGGAIGGTVAWLVDTTGEVVNTFTYGDINITLTETNTNLDDDDDPTTNQYAMIPGNDLTKDPKVTVTAGSEASWLFVKLVEAGGATVEGETYGFEDFLTYAIAEGWTELEEGVYYREVDKSDEEQVFSVLKDDKVTVKDSVTKEMLNALDADPKNATYPTLTITAYAVQKDNITSAADAWKVAKGEDITPTESTAPAETTA